MQTRWLTVVLATLLACRPRVNPDHAAVAPRLQWAQGPEAPDTPVVVVLHGLGDTPQGILRLASALSLEHEAHAPQAPTPWRGGFSWFSPGATSQDPATLCAEIQSAADGIADDLRQLDLSEGGKRKVALTGFSQGGILAFQLAFRHGELFDLVAPLAGHVPGPCLPEEGPHPSSPPLRAFHGQADGVLPVENVRASIEGLTSRGWSARLQTYPALGHQISSQLVGDLSQTLREGLAGPPG